MKKRNILWGGLLLLTALMGCGQSPEAPVPSAAPTASVEVHLETAAPRVTPEVLAALMESEPPSEAAPPAERILGHCLSVVDALPCSVDLDGDGTEEIVDLEPVPGAEDQQPRWAILLTSGGQQKRFLTDIPEDMPHDLWVGDLDEDGRYELFFHGDLASSDYVIYGFRDDLSCLFFEPDERAARWGDSAQSSVFSGYIEGFEDGHLVISGAVDMLGTHWGVRAYAIGDDGVIGPVSTVWQFIDEAEADTPLTVTRALTAYKAALRKDPGEAFPLKIGARIYLLASDGCGRMWFETETGRGGVLLLTPDEENMWLIDGVPECECFEFLPYAG